MNFVKALGLCKSFHAHAGPAARLVSRIRGRGGRMVRALQDVGFEAAAGQMLGVAGRNGSGKSTLLRLLSGALAQDSGSLEAPLRRASLLELGCAFNREETGRRNVDLAWLLRGMAADERARRMDELAEFSEMGRHLDLPVKHYSGGQFLRLAFGEAVLWEPDLLVLDEVVAVGDAGFQDRCLKRVEALKARGAVLVLATHDLGLLERFCERAIWLEEGRARMTGTGAEVARAYAASFA